MFEAIAFYLFAFLTTMMFFIAVTTSQALHALTALAAGMIFISAFFFILGRCLLWSSYGSLRFWYDVF